MPTCAAPAGSACRTGKGKVAIQYHTARFRLVPQLAKALSVPTPAIRKPGSVWTELPRPVSADAEPARHVRLGYDRASTAPQSLDAQLDSLAEAGVTRVFSEKISTRATRHPDLEAAVKYAGEIRSSGVAVTSSSMSTSGSAAASNSPCSPRSSRPATSAWSSSPGSTRAEHDPSGILFTVLAAMSGMEREYIRDRTLEDHESARKRGETIGGAGVTDESMLSMALHLCAQEMSLRAIAKRLVITTGAKKGQHPSPPPPSCGCSAVTTSRSPQRGST